MTYFTMCFANQQKKFMNRKKIQINISFICMNGLRYSRKAFFVNYKKKWNMCYKHASSSTFYSENKVV